MYEGKEKRLELIRELQSTHALQLAGQMEKRSERQSVLSDQRMRRLDTHKVRLARLNVVKYLLRMAEKTSSENSSITFELLELRYN